MTLCSVPKLSHHPYISLGPSTPVHTHMNTQHVSLSTRHSCYSPTQLWSVHYGDGRARGDTQLPTSGVRRHATVPREIVRFEPSYCLDCNRSIAVTGPTYVTLKATWCFEEVGINGGFDKSVLHDGRERKKRYKKKVAQHDKSTQESAHAIED